VGSWIAGVGAELDRGRLPTRYLGRAGCLSNPTGVWIKRGAPSPVGFGPGVGSGRIRGGSGTGAMVASSVPGPLSDQTWHLPRHDRPRSTLISIRHPALRFVVQNSFSVRCPSSTFSENQTILDQNSHMVRQVSLQAANNGPYAQLMVSACRAIGWRLSKGGSLRRYLPRPRQRHLYLDQDVTNGNHFLGAFIYVASRLPILINQKRPYPAWMLYDRLRPATTALNLDSAELNRHEQYRGST
jgi:hypothetical protein